MTEPTVTAELDRLQNSYRVRFAGHARVSRDPDELEDFLATLTALEARATVEEKERITRDRDLYAREVASIREAHAVPNAVPAARLRMWADLALHRYQRSFANQDRRTRDAQLLESLVAELESIQKEMKTLDRKAPDQNLGAAVETLDRSLEIYRNEAEAIRTARRTGTLGEQGSRFAQLANDQFEAYREHFAGQPRISRHAPILTRIIASLEELLRGMKSLRLAGLNDPSNDNNQKIVADRIEQYRKELDMIGSQQRSTPLVDRVNALGTAANKIFQEYRENFAGKDRASRDLSKLALLGEKLWPLAKEMDTLDRTADNETNSRNLRIVTDNLLLYQREWASIKEARSGAEPKAAN
jgi:hypothetical protein